MPTADVSVTDSAVEVTLGLYDTDDGFKAKVSGDDFWRVHVTPQGVVSVGDGTEAPTSLSTTLAAYTPDDSDVWDGDPTTIASALDRIAAVVGLVTPIP